MRCVERVWPVGLPSVFPMTEGFVGTDITDGGSDVFDHGNELRVRFQGRWSAPLQYSQVCDGALMTPVGLGDAKYVTCKLTSPLLEASFGAVFVAAVESRAQGIDGFMVDGNLGADGKGMQHANNGTDGTELRGPGGLVGYYKQTHDAGTPPDPSVNHLIFAAGDAGLGAQVRIGSTTDSDLHDVRFKSGLGLVYYVMWAGKHGHAYDVRSMQYVLEAVGASCLGKGPVPSPITPGGVPGGAPADAGSVFGTVLLVLCVLGGAAYFGYGWYRGWEYPRTKALATAAQMRVKGFAARSRTGPTPTPSFDSAGPLSSSTHSIGRGMSQAPLTLNDSATSYIASPEGATPYTPPPTSSGTM